MSKEFIRTQLLLGSAAMDRLSKARVAVFGVGGVGGYVVEALARSGVGALDLIDNDVVDITNINRQIIALHSTIGQPKVLVAASRVKDINPDCIVNTYQTFYLPENSSEFDFTQYDYIVDAIDTVSGKLEIIVNAKAAGTPVISSMGAGNKLDPTAFQITDIYKTSVCPLAKVMRHECKKRGIKQLKVLFSTEPAKAPIIDTEEAIESTKLTEGSPRRSTPGSNAFVPSVAGLIIAGEIIKDLTQ